MKRVFSALDSVEVGLLQSVLEAADIPYEVRNVAIPQVAGPSLIIPTELWILRDQDYEEAVCLLERSRSEERGGPEASRSSMSGWYRLGTICCFLLNLMSLGAAVWFVYDLLKNTP
jgi:Putative prokaryotic signal transducing protein